MEIKLIESGRGPVSQIISEDIILNDVQDALDLMANCNYQGSENLIVQKHNISDDFFNLRTGLAGEILQKFSNYRCRLAIVGDFSGYSGKSLSDFIKESNKTGRILFLSSMDEAIERLTR